jgi:hypothetical protein
MNIKFFNVALGIVLTATAFSASAQKTYTQGVLSYSSELRGNPADVKEYFTADSNAAVITFGPGTVKILRTAKNDYLAVLLDIPVASLKKVGVATPAELEGGLAAYPTFTFTPTTETKTISGFNCKKVIAKNTKDGKTYDTWITNDITVPSTAMRFYYASIGGFPVKFTDFQVGPGGAVEVSITISSITDQKAPAGTFSLPKDVPSGSLADLSAGG